jgi:hypothetical protein
VIAKILTSSMHQEHNVVKSIISMCFDVIGFSKDSVNARKDLSALCNHRSLEPKRNLKGDLKRPREEAQI